MDFAWLDEVFGEWAPAVALAVLAAIAVRYVSIEVARHRTASENKALRTRMDELHVTLSDVTVALRSLSDRLESSGGAGAHTAEALIVTEAQAAGDKEWRPGDVELAAEFWNRLSERGRSVFAFLATHPEQRFNGEELAAALSIPNGRFGVAGVLAWPGRHAKALGRRLPLRWTEQDGKYWMDQEQAALFAPHAARHPAN